VKARQDGLRHVLFKPFRVDQLLTALAADSPETAPTHLPGIPDVARADSGSFRTGGVGHLVLVLACHNIAYGQNLPRHSGKLVHVLFGLLFLAGPILIYYYWDWNLLTLFTLEPLDWRRLLTAVYVALCWFTAVVWFPSITIYRLTRAAPAVQLSQQSRVFDWRRRRAALVVCRESAASRSTAAERGASSRDDGADAAAAAVAAGVDGLTILHISDLHFHQVPTQAWHEAVMDRLAAWEPDVVAVTGDMVDSIPCQEWIVPILSRLRYRIAAFAILGNHDYWFEVPTIRANLTKAGLRVLTNRWNSSKCVASPCW